MQFNNSTSTKNNTNMKSRFRMLLAAITFFAGLALLFAALALPLRLAAQDKQDPDLLCPPFGVCRGNCQVNDTGQLNGLCLASIFHGGCLIRPSADCTGTVNPPRHVVSVCQFFYRIDLASPCSFHE